MASLLQSQNSCFRCMTFSLIDFMQYQTHLIVTFQVSGGSISLGGHGILTTANKEVVAHVARSCSKIPQLDGPIPDPYDDVLSTPNVSMVLQFERHSMQTNTLLLLFFFPLPCIWICVYLACIPTSSGPSILPFDFSY